MQFYFFHLMPWPYLPEGYSGPAWIKCPNDFYDPIKGNALYNRYLDELEYAETLGFDGVVVNEHHQNAYGLMPSPNLFAATLARRTSKVKIAVVGNALPLYNPPIRVAEEFAIIDVISGGRLIAGMVVGGGPEYYSYGINPTEARARFAEALDLIVSAWTKPGPFSFYGNYYNLPYCNPWPKPFQKPHPPIWIPGIGSIETMQLVAEKKYSYTGIPFFHMNVFEKNYSLFRRTWLEKQNEPDPNNLGLLLPVYVSDSDETARAEYEEHFWYFAHRLLDGVQISPPGYTSLVSALRMSESQSSFLISVKDWKDVISGNYAIVGSPNTVIEKLCECISKLGAGHFMGMFQIGTLPHQLTKTNMELFSSEVMPAIKKEFPKGPLWKD
jgi:alkanesulfonate monooxygenase SsuD/methylene tetrahydromethanopterin reductase-like flavin-dependent oxidoreductase (luciferase family)